MNRQIKTHSFSGKVNNAKFLNLISYFLQYQLISQKMGLREILTNSILRMDLLSTSPTFRTRKQPQYQTIFGGLISLIIMCLFGYFLYLQMTSMFQNLDISYTQGLDDYITSQSAISSFPFAISINGVDLSITPRKFMFNLWQMSIAKGTNGPTVTKTSISLSPCNLSDWSSLGDDFLSQAKVFGFTQMLCITSGQNISLAGYAGSDPYKYLNLQILQCNQTLDPNCDTTSNINTYMSNYLTTNNYFQVRFFVLDTILTPTNETPQSLVLQKNIFLAFSSTIGTVGYINMALYQIDTDTSVLPITSYDTVTGTYIQKYNTNSVSLSNTQYVDFNVYKSTKFLSVSRTIGKIDTILSYVGGLFSLLFTGIAFFLGSYSEYKYELYVAESMLTVDDKGKRIRESDLGFVTYILYKVYDWLDTFGIAPKCLTKLSDMHQIRQQVCEQLDPVIFLKRIKYLQEVSKLLLDEHRQMCLYLSEPLSLQQSRRMRKTLCYYDNLIEELGQSQERRSPTIVNDQKYLSEIKGNAVHNECEQEQKAQEKQQEKQLTEQEEEELLNSIMIAAIEKLESDNSLHGKKLKSRISKRKRDWIKETKVFSNKNKQNQGEFQNQIEMVSPVNLVSNDERGQSIEKLNIVNKNKVKMNIRMSKI